MISIRARLVALTLVAGLSFQGCYGSFGATRAIHSWNGNVGGKFVNTLVFWALVIIPVYELLALGDAIIFNVIEFWTGSNPIAANGQAQPEMLADGSMRFEREGHTYRVQRTSDGGFVIWRDAARVAEATIAEDGRLTVRDFDRNRVVEISREDVADLQAVLAAR